ncbi:hypothetical protein [Tsukamurella tyrosinosolvens]|nr:hypothetical protein [Tsukamurella tyrosinosolvens]
MNGNTQFDRFDDAIAEASAAIGTAFASAENEVREQLAVLFLEADSLRKVAA